MARDREGVAVAACSFLHGHGVKARMCRLPATEFPLARVDLKPEQQVIADLNFFLVDPLPGFHADQ